MSVLTQTEKNSTVGRLFLGGVLTALILGSVTMIYPFVLMVSGSLRSEMDSSDMSAVPQYFLDRDELARKFLETKYDYDVGNMNQLRGYPDFNFRQATLPERIVPKRLDDFRRFVEESDLPDHWWGLGGTVVHRYVASPNSTRFVTRLRERYEGDLNALGEDLGSPIPKWRYVTAGIPQWEDPRWRYAPSPYWEVYFGLLQDRPLAERSLVSLSGWFRQNLLFPRYGKTDTDQYNLVHTRTITNWTEFSLPRTLPGPDQPRLRAEWTEFVRGVVNISFVRSNAPAEAYLRFLRERYDVIDTLNERWNTGYADFDSIPALEDTRWIHAGERPDVIDFLARQPLESLYLVGPEMAWRDWLRDTYGSVEAANQAHEREVSDWKHFPFPWDELEMQYALENAGAMRRELAGRNFRTVFAEILFQGRPLLNTLIYVALSLFFSLTLQPLAAYALSRFSPPGTWRIILFFMATMAFPPMVGMIPQFLILRHLNLLNTFVGLVLPGLINGYLIFLLKGFFDSLPKHLYEAALIDGAGELRMFFTLTMALSKPILAVVALGTFNHAWLAFLYPLLVCPEEQMHVLAIWLYQFQQQAPTPAVFASILITSIPSLLIFVFTQRTIMKGIAVPAEK